MEVAQIIDLYEKDIVQTMQTDDSDASNPDRVWILRKNFNNYLYFRDLQNYAPQLFQSILAQTSIAGPQIEWPEDDATGQYDYSQKTYTGFKRKFTAIIGNRMPNAIAVPNNSADEEGVQSTKSANQAAIFIREKCGLEEKHLDQAAKMFDNGTTFWHVDWVEDGDKYGYRTEPQMGMVPKPLGDGGFDCVNCGQFTPAEAPEPAPACSTCGQQLSAANFKPPTMAQVPGEVGPPKKVPKGALEINVHDSTEISAPLDSVGIDDCDWLRWDREDNKGRLLRKHGEALRKKMSDDAGHETVASQMGELVRSALASPIGLVRPNRANRWTCSDVWWTPNQFELVQDDKLRGILQQQFPSGCRFIFIKGKLLDIKEENLQEHWQECKPEPFPRIMTDALGDEWTSTTDISNNTLNECQESISRSNLPILVNAQKFDQDAWANRRNLPAEIFGILPRAGRSLGDEIFQPQPYTFSEQIPAYREQVLGDTKNNSGLVDAIWGGGEPDPTARQTLLKTNQALMQLGTYWTQIRKCLEKVLLKSCKLLAQYAEGIISFSKKNQFGKFDTISFTAEDLKSDSYHFEADEAIPINWGQQRDQLIWLLGQAAEAPQLLDMLGLNDPFNIVEIKQLLGIPGMRTEQFDAREKGMNVISQLLTEAPQPGQPGPDGQPGDPQPSIQPDWEDNHQFMTNLAKAYLVDNSTLKTEKPDGYANVQAWGKAHEQMANPPAAPPPPKVTIATSFKGSDIGAQATQAILSKEGVLPDGVQIQPAPDPKLLAMTQPQAAPVNGVPAPPAGPPQPQQ